MNIYCLTKEEYKGKLPHKMFEVTETGEAVLDIWPYVKALAQNNLISDYVYSNNLVEHVYRDSMEKYDHILLPAKFEDKFIVIVVDIVDTKIDGYYLLNLKDKYGLYKLGK